MHCHHNNTNLTHPKTYENIVSKMNINNIQQKLDEVP